LKKEFNISAIAIEDDNFFTNKKRALEIIRNIGIPWESSIRANYVSQWGEDFIRELKENNCVELRIGAESGSQRILDILHKDITVEDVYKAVELGKKYNIRILLNFMIGIPGESWPEMLKTFQVMDEMEKMGNDIIVSGPSVYYPWPGTPLLKPAVEKGFKLPKKMEDWAVNWGPKQPTVPYVDKKVKFIGFYRISVFRKDLDSLKFPFFAKLLRFIAKKRWEKRYFRFPIDYYIPRFFLNLIKALGLRKIAQSIYD
jgi:anaerobic magnesium-protoporphyrin IX monomethyl ester cyclase